MVRTDGSSWSCAMRIRVATSGPLGSSSVEEGAGVDFDAISEVCAGDLGHGGQVEQGELEAGVLRRRGGEEGAVAAAHVDQVLVRLKS